jgi:hypothetical protein
MSQRETHPNQPDSNPPQTEASCRQAHIARDQWPRLYQAAATGAGGFRVGGTRKTKQRAPWMRVHRLALSLTITSRDEDLHAHPWSMAMAMAMCAAVAFRRSTGLLTQPTCACCLGAVYSGRTIARQVIFASQCACTWILNLAIRTGLIILKSRSLLGFAALFLYATEEKLWWRKASRNSSEDFFWASKCLAYLMCWVVKYL